MIEILLKSHKTTKLSIMIMIIIIIIITTAYHIAWTDTGLKKWVSLFEVMLNPLKENKAETLSNNAFSYNLIFFIFISFPAIILVKIFC